MAWAQEESSPAKSGGSDAANPVVQGPPTPPPPGPSPTDEALKAQQAKIEALSGDQTRLREELEVLSAILGAEREQRAEEVIGLREKAEKAELALKRPPVFTAKGGVGITGYLQADLGAWRQSSEDQVNPSTLQPINEMRFVVRRARLRTILEKTYVAGALEFDGNTVNGSTARIVGAEASLKLPGDEGGPPLLMGTIGLFKIPFGFELQQSDRDRLFMERSIAEQALFPGEYDVGARLAGTWRFLRLAVAVQNGDPLGERAFPGRDPNAAKDVAGRAGVDTAITDDVSIAGGVSLLKGTGFHRGTPATKPTISWSDRNEDGQFQPNEVVTTAGVAATPSGNFNRFAYGLDLGLAVGIPHLGKATVYGELYLAKNMDRARLIADPLGPVGRDYREAGGYVAGLLDIGELVTVGARWEKYNPDVDSTDPVRALVPTDLSYDGLSLAAEVHNANGRLVIEYDHVGNKLGRSSTGMPTTLKDDSVVLRGQVSF